MTPNRRALSQLADQHNKSSLTFEQQCSDFEIKQHVLKSFKKIGAQLEFFKKELPVAIALVTEEWTQTNNLLTAAMKMKRKQVNDFYKKQIDEMFEKESNQLIH